MKILVNGLGSIGKRHIKNLKRFGYNNITGYDISAKVVTKVKKELKIDTSNDYIKSLIYSDLVFICNPPSFHVEDTKKALKAGAHVFLEKPISNTFEDAKKLIDEKKIMVGFNMRFHPMVIFLKRFKKKIGKIYNVKMEYGYDLSKARNIKKLKHGYYSSKKDGGVLLDHIHEFDTAQNLFGKFNSIFCKEKKISNLKIHSNDCANIIMISKSGFDVSMHFNYFQKKYNRKIEIISSKGIVECNFSSGVFLFRNNNGKSYIKRFKNGFDLSYKKEIEILLKNIKKNKSHYPSIKNCLNSSYIVKFAKKSNKLNKIIKL